MKVAIIHLTMTIHCGMRGKTTTTSHPRLVQRGVDRATPTMRHGSRALLLLRLLLGTTAWVWVSALRDLNCCV